MKWIVTAFLALVFAGAALLHGMVGIGFTLIPTAILALNMGMQEAVVLTVLPMLLINSISVLTGGAVWPILRRYTLLALSSVAGSFIGVKLLLHALHENELPFINGGESVHVPEIPTLLSLAVIVLTLLVTMVASLIKSRMDQTR